MNQITYLNGLASDTYLPPASSSKQPASGPDLATGDAEPVDQVDLTHSGDSTSREISLAGRIALNTAAGKLSSDQTAQLYLQVASIHALILADKQADGGTLSAQDAKTINEMQSNLSDQIYTDAHHGAVPPSDHSAPAEAVKREELLAGRIETNEKAGNLTTSQAQALKQQQAQIDREIAADQQANGGSLTPEQARQINQLQNQASKQIYEAVHGITPTEQ